jgi:host factor-I protein
MLILSLPKRDRRNRRREVGGGGGDFHRTPRPRVVPIRPGPDNSTKKREPMATEKSQNVQDVFLNHIRKGKIPVTVFLVNGVKLQGIVTWFDNFSVLLRRDAHSQLVYKHAISTIMPGQPIQLAEIGDVESAAD